MVESDPSKDKRFHATACLPVPEQSPRRDLCIVQNKEIAGLQDVGHFPEGTVLDPSVSSVEPKQARRRAVV
jgi:hypothetical protein